jgi:thioesterase domain-containing protein
VVPVIQSEERYAAALLDQLRAQDIRVRAEDGKLQLDAPSGALTAEIREQLARHKHMLLDFLASVGRLAERPRAIVPLQQNGAGIPVFAAGGHNGDVFCYRLLSSHLGADQPFYGLQPPGVMPGSEPLGSVPELATYFADQITGFAPRGPCVIAGFCAGGTVAWELACELHARGMQVERLVLFASPYPAWFRAGPQRRVRVAAKAAVIAKHARALSALPWRAWRQYFISHVAERQARRAREDEEERAAQEDAVMSARRRVENATLAAVREYVPRPYAGRVSLFVPDRRWGAAGGPGRGWRRVAPGAEEYYGSEGCTGDNILRSPHAAVTAQLFAQSSSGARTPQLTRVPPNGVVQPQ